jgi:hypothetical protein
LRRARAGAVAQICFATAGYGGMPSR